MHRIHSNIERCKKCPLYVRGKAVPGEGPPDSDIVLVGQNPGRTESDTGRPFVGRAGKYLDKVLEDAGLDREKLFITSVVKHGTPQNRMPVQEEVAACMPYLLGQLGQIRPSKVVLMGKLAWGVPRTLGSEYLQTYHPAAAMRFPKYGEKFVSDMCSLSP